MIEKAMDSGADEVFFDLEDAVAPIAKDQARSLVAEALRTLGPFRHLQAVRINDVHSGLAWRDVVEIVPAAEGHLGRIILPKVRTPSDVIYIEKLLDEIEGDAPPEQRVELELLVETASGACRLTEILAASERAVAVILGLGDYTAELGVERPLSFGMDHEVTAWAASTVVNNAVAFGISAVDGPYPGLRDEGGYRDAAKRARRFGFSSKWCVHPAQVPWCNEAFSPDASELADARRILDAYDSALADGTGALALDGRLVDEATRKHALKLLSSQPGFGLGQGATGTEGDNT